MRIDQQETAVDAFHAHRGAGQSAAQRNRILSFIKASGGNWSIGEIAHMLGLEKSTVSARMNELLTETGELVEKCRRKDRFSGIKVRALGLPSVQLDLLQ
jgi:DNA-binding IclR family transcriptional regulator